MDRKSQIRDQTLDNAKKYGQFICPDDPLLKVLLDGLAKNEERYGYPCCPCRTASGIKDYDEDIICPCEYKDADVDQYGTCYCGLYVSKEVHEDPKKLQSIPERRSVEVIDAANDAFEQKEKGTLKERPVAKAQSNKKIQIWRCVVCGYLCARESPPSICPICKAKKDRFEPFSFG
jgi:ferredoxin-thioredoxin reductase catalytic subunit